MKTTGKIVKFPSKHMAVSRFRGGQGEEGMSLKGELVLFPGMDPNDDGIEHGSREEVPNPKSPETIEMHRKMWAASERYERDYGRPPPTQWYEAYAATYKLMPWNNARTFMFEVCADASRRRALTFEEFHLVMNFLEDTLSGGGYKGDFVPPRQLGELQTFFRRWRKAGRPKRMVKEVFEGEVAKKWGVQQKFEARMHAPIMERFYASNIHPLRLKSSEFVDSLQELLTFVWLLLEDSVLGGKIRVLNPSSPEGEGGRKAAQ